MSTDRSVMGEDTSSQDPTLFSGDSSDSDSESEKDSKLASAKQVLIQAVRDQLQMQDDPSLKQSCRYKHQPLLFPNYGEFEELVSKGWKHPERL